MVEKVKVDVVREKGVTLPAYKHETDAGADVRSVEKVIIPPGESACVHTGMRFDIPDGWEIQVRPRSGLALKHQVTVLNTPATIDAHYTGPIKILLINHGKKDFEILPGDRIAQLVMAPVTHICWNEVRELAESARGEKGFGSTGVK